ncbi:MAG: TIGR03936 family radical SAM-associated protein [Planctomycetes bacterium]|nr:TIGR03936 family radical SAM-associated protein [Planctomycetota bacterium]
MAISRYRVRFEKRDALRFISHHDLMRVFELALRRSGLKVAFTQGFNPHPRLSFALALPLGVESFDELVDIDLEHGAQPLDPAQLVQVLGLQMPSGLVLLDARIATGRPHVVAAEYHCELPPGRDPVELQARLDAFLSGTSHPYSRSRGDDKAARNFDARAFVLAASIGQGRLFMRLRTGASGGMKPSDLLTILGLDPLAVLVTKTRTVLDETLPGTASSEPENTAQQGE